MFDHIAHLSRLNFSDAEKESIRHDMQKMVTFFEQLNQLDTTGVEPLVFLSGTEQQMRADGPVTVNEIPGDKSSYYTVPKVIENPAQS